MKDEEKPKESSLDALQERAKELNCLYAIDELLSRKDITIDQALKAVIPIIPPGFQYPVLCRARIIFEDSTYESPDFVRTAWSKAAEIMVQDRAAGRLEVYYTKEVSGPEDGPFLKEEVKLIQTIAERLGHFIVYDRLKRTLSTEKLPSGERKEEWRVALDLLRQTDRNLFLSISHKMLNYLCWTGIDEAKKLLRYYSPDQRFEEDELLGGLNRPYQRKVPFHSSDFLSDETFKIASDHISDDEILSVIQKWIQEDRVSFLVKVLNRNSSLTEVADAIRRYHRMSPQGGMELPTASRKGVKVSLIRRFFSEQLEFINIAKNYIDIPDFHDLLQKVVYTSESVGKLGGKAAGLFLASQILKKSEAAVNIIGNLKIPKTWYISADVMLYFVEHNNLEEVIEQKYKDINQVRLEYPHIVQTFKNAHFPPDVIQGLSAALDDFRDQPLIVRSSSLLEDRIGAAFSGKYKSLFLANRGSKQERLDALTDAVAEVYASVFGPDPIEYRAERGLLDFHEEMAIMIQEVVGTRVGDYFMPVYAGVAFSNNEFRWSPRIKRGDGLLRIVPGLGTRAVDRLSDDYPVLIAPGQPSLRANVTADEMLRYSPRKIDVINLKANIFETIEVAKFLREFGQQIPNVSQLISICEDNSFHQPVGSNIDFDRNNLVVTLEGLISRTEFVNRIRTILRLLEEKLSTPVDIEFASDGTDFYLLQCRPQSYTQSATPAPIPKDVPEEKMIFSANRYVSNGRVPDITHIVYVDPQKYGELSERSDLLAVGRAVSGLNKLLPKRQFILLGPGRWGSRGDIKLGVSVTYSDINNTAVLIEIARKKGNYVPDLSFGTHFFQDLVEANIRYLPLYPDDPGIYFNERFLRNSPSILSAVLPEFGHLSDTIRLIDVPGSTNGQILRVLMNADLDEAVAILSQPTSQSQKTESKSEYAEQPAGDSWRWRLRVAAYVASQIEPERFGVRGFYVFGSTKNATAGPASDIDVLVHFNGDEEQRRLLCTWLEGWSLCLDEMNYLRTGYRTGGLLDVHIVTDDDIARKNSYAAKIGAVTDAARPLPLKKPERQIKSTRESPSRDAED